MAVLASFPPAALDQVDWAFEGSTPPSGNSRMEFFENQTHGGKSYVVYRENEADAAMRSLIGDPVGMSISMRFGASGYIERDAVYSGHLARKKGLYTANREGKYENYSLEIRDAIQNLPKGEELDVGGESPRRVAALPTTGYRLGDMVFLTAKDGSNEIGLYKVFDASDGYEPAEVQRKPLVLLAWDESRAYADVTLPANYADYRFIRMVLEVTDLERPYITYPTTALQDPERDQTGNRGQLGVGQQDKFTFNRTTRVISRIASTNSIDRFLYMELFS